MLVATYEEVRDGNNVLIKNVLVVRFNGKLVNSVDFPPELTMTQDEADTYVAGKLSGLIY